MGSIDAQAAARSRMLREVKGPLDRRVGRTAKTCVCKQVYFGLLERNKRCSENIRSLMVSRTTMNVFWTVIACSLVLISRQDAIASVPGVLKFERATSDDFDQVHKSCGAPDVPSSGDQALKSSHYIFYRDSSNCQVGKRVRACLTYAISQRKLECSVAFYSFGDAIQLNEGDPDFAHLPDGTLPFAIQSLTGFVVVYERRNGINLRYVD